MPPLPPHFSGAGTFFLVPAILVISYTANFGYLSKSKRCAAMKSTLSENVYVVSAESGDSNFFEMVR